MDSIIQKASEGNRTALKQLYESNKHKVYFLCRALLRNDAAALPAAQWALKSTLVAVEIGEVQSEDAFSAYAVKQAASYCKRNIIKKDSHAFKLPPQKNFHICHVNENYIDLNVNAIENYINCLPATQRFALVLYLVGSMDEQEIARIIGFDIKSVTLLKGAEDGNLNKIYHALQANGIRCSAPTPEFLTIACDDALSQTYIPDELEKYMLDYIDSIAAPIEEAAKNKRKLYYIVSAAIVVTAAILLAMLVGGENNNTTIAEKETVEIVTSTDTDMTVPTLGNVSDIEFTGEEATAKDNVADEKESAALEASPIYYADIEIQDYGTITVQLDQASAPITVANFVSLAESGFYDGLTFHRIMEGFMMQGGDPEGNGTGGSDESIVGEFTANGYDNTLSHTRGAISMARANDYNSASSQFFIVHEDSSTSLDGQYAVFGYVIKGMDVVDAVCETAEPIDSNGMIAADAQPVITSITIRTEPGS